MQQNVNLVGIRLERAQKGSCCLVCGSVKMNPYTVEITYVSYDSNSKCYYYGIRTFNKITEQYSTVKRRRFREFLQLYVDLTTEKQSSIAFPASKYWSTSPEIRKPQLERYLNLLLNEAPNNKDLIKFLGLDSPTAFPPIPRHFEQVEAEYFQKHSEEIKQEIANELIIIMLVTFFLFEASSRNTIFGLSIFAILIGVICYRHYLAKLNRRKQFLQEEKSRTSAIKIEHKPCQDLSVSAKEAESLPTLRERLVDFVNGTTPEFDIEFLKLHGKTCQGLLGSTEEVSLSNKNEERKLVWDNNILQDHRLVLFLRFNPTLDLAESQARFAMTTRVALQMEHIFEQFRPPENIFAYGASPLLTKYSQNVKEQIKDRVDNWWLRDRQGSLCMFARLGHMPSGLVFEQGFQKDADLMNRTMIFFVEMFRLDMEYIHVSTQGRSQCHATVVADMAGFDLNLQMGTSDVLNMVKKYVPLMAPCYGGLLKRYIIINAPWYVNMLLSIVRPFIPKDILDSVRIYSGFDKVKMLDEFIENKYIPKYLGGELEGENGDIYCRNRLAPFGPFEPDQGMSLLTMKPSNNSNGIVAHATTAGQPK